MRYHLYPVLQQAKLAYSSRNVLKRIENICRHKNLYTNVHSRIICNNQTVKTTDLSTNRWMNQQSVAFQNHEILFGQKKKKKSFQFSATNTGSWKPDTKGYNTVRLFYVWSPEEANPTDWKIDPWLPGAGRKEECTVTTKRVCGFFLRRWKNVLN